VDAFSIGLQVAFAAVFVVVLTRYLRDRRPVNRDLVLVAGAFAGWLVIATLRSVWPGLPAELGRLSAMLVLLVPFLTLRLVRHVASVGRNAQLAAFAWYLLSLVLVLGVGLRGNPLPTAIVVGYFVIFEAAAGLMLWRAADARFGYARTRLRIAGLATVLIATAILVAGIASASAPPEVALNEDLTFASRLLALAGGLGWLAAFLPPEPLRRFQQRAIAFDLGLELIAAPDGHPDGIWQTLAQSVRRVAGARAAVVAIGDPPIIRAVDGIPPAALATGTVLNAEGTSLDQDGSTTIIPIGSSGVSGSLVVFVERNALFLEDDRILLTMLADQAARAAERQEAIHERLVLASELEDASHELAESRARLEGEARFRVALEAHPGILLVVDPDGLIGYANEQALACLGYDRDEIRTVPLHDLLTTAPEIGEVTVGVMPAEARRRDGTVFPVDYAVSTFESGGSQYSIAVLTDISDRLQTERLRDTFIGMLSHELRTPVTAIYGGSQVLLNRGDRLDSSTRHELIADVASESERLHRLIENLLVLARVERGQDLAGGEPVLLQRVLPTIVDRERSLWPGAHIDMVIPAGLPTVRGHDGYVGQVVRNLLSNAAKYAGDGAKIQILAESGASGVSVRVRDDGVGIQSDHADHLFDLYYRAPGAADRAPGAGIGLFVCRHIVTALGGRIWARPGPEGGAEFGFELPIYEPEDEPSPVEADEVDEAEVAAAS